MKKIFIFSLFIFFFSLFFIKTSSPASAAACEDISGQYCNDVSCSTDGDVSGTGTCPANRHFCCKPTAAPVCAATGFSCAGGKRCCIATDTCKPGVTKLLTCIAAPPPPSGSNCTGTGEKCIGPKKPSCDPGLIEDPNISCTISGGSGRCCVPSATTPDCYINIDGYCEPNNNEQNLGCDGATCETAMGKIETTVAGFINGLFAKILGIVGGLAVLLIIISGYKLMASQGNPEKVQGAKEQLTAAIIGLLFVIFSLVILHVIGYDILRLPGFNP